MFPSIFCAICAQKFWWVHTFSGTSPKFLCSKSKAVFVTEIKWRPKKKKKVFTQKRAVFVSETFLVWLTIVVLCSTTICLSKNMSVRSKFMRVRILWSLCARAHAHSLKGTLAVFILFKMLCNPVHLKNVSAAHLNLSCPLLYVEPTARTFTKNLGPHDKNLLVYINSENFLDGPTKQNTC